MCFRYEAKMNASLPSILIDNHYKSFRYDQTFSFRTQAGKCLQTKV